MIRQYFTQAWAQLRAQPLMSAVTVAGTALAIFLIMLVVMVQQVQVAPFAPESRRDRFLHIRWMSITNREWGEGQSSNGPMSVRTARECFGSLETPEAVTVYGVATLSKPVSLPGQAATAVDVRDTDDVFWRVFDFTFIYGKPFGRAELDAALPMAVITESVARLLFGRTDVAGEEFLLAHAPYKVCGVVKDVSTLADEAYAQVWVPYTTGNAYTDTWNDGHMGAMSCLILAKSRSDFPAIRRECERKRLAYNTVIGGQGWELFYRNRPYDQEKHALGSGANEEPDLQRARTRRYIIYLILLIVPAINLSGMTQSRLRQRMAEVGVRRAFGSTRLEVMGRLLAENLAVTLLAGLLGLLMSVAFAYLGSSQLFALGFSFTLARPTVDASILIHTSTFLWALFFCFVLNLLSTGIPAWRAARMDIVEAINGKVR